MELITPVVKSNLKIQAGRKFQDGTKDVNFW